jgi:hypothetical protein
MEAESVCEALPYLVSHARLDFLPLPKISYAGVSGQKDRVVRGLDRNLA